MLSTLPRTRNVRPRCSRLAWRDPLSLFVALLVAACGGRATWDRNDEVPGTGTGGSAAGGAPQDGSGGAGAGTGGVPTPGGGTGGEPEPPLGHNPWQESDEPFCQSGGEVFEHRPVDLWSQPGSVYLMVDSQIYANHGTGWALVTDSGRANSGGLTGFADGLLVRYGSATARCGIEFVDSEGNDSCAAAISSADAVYVVHGTLALAAEGHKLFRYEGEHWVASASLDSSAWVLSLWGTESTLLLATTEGAYVSHGSGAPVLQDLPVTDVSAGATYPTSVWGFSDEELWVGNSEGELFHRQDGSWTLAWSSNSTDECRAITGMWGHGGQLFVTTLNSVYTVETGGHVRRLAHRPCDPEGRAGFWSIWGNSAEEVFVAEQKGGESGACGRVELSWFDGTQWGHL